MEIVKYITSQDHVSQNTVDEFEGIIIAKNNVNLYRINNLKRILGKVFIKLCLKSTFPLPKFFFRRRTLKSLCIMLGDEFHKAVFPFINNEYNNIYFFDAWPSNHYYIEKFIRMFRVKNVFFSAKQVVEVFEKKNLNCKFHWVPEAINMENYTFLPYSEKDIQVLAFGRKFDSLHHLIVKGLKEQNITYLYEKKPGHILFPAQDDFLKGLSQTKISICIPANITHPERSEGISTMTIRYLQSMSSKCLILGFLPDDMQELFEHNPIIQLDMNDPLEQIKDILKNYDDYIPLIERNFEYVKAYHTWSHRADTIKELL